MQFTNSLWAPGCGGVYLFGDDCASVRSLRELLKSLATDRERWKSGLFVEAAISELGVTSGSALEREVMKLTPNLVYPDDRPHLFDRMRQGEPQIAKVFSNSEHISRPWVDLLLQLAKTPLEIFWLPLWRLLDPEPLTWIEYHVAFGRVMVSTLRVLRTALTRPENELDSSGTGLEWSHATGKSDQEVMTINVDHSDNPPQVSVLPPPRTSNLHSLSCLLLSLRYWELVGDLESYYLTLRMAVELFERPHIEADLRPLQKGGPAYLRSAFGRVVARHTWDLDPLPARLEQAWVRHAALRSAEVGQSKAELQLDARRIVTFEL